jgi:acyl-coenzyme A thioesterase PaaI-like protein
VAKPNKLNTIVSNVYKLPEFMRTKALSTLFGKTVKYTGTTGIKVEELTTSRSVVTLTNKKSVQNHIGSVHAVASILIAESATGYLIGMNISDDCVPVIKTIKADYVKRAKGNMRAEASLTDEQIKLITSSNKGETTVPVTVTDADGKEPILMEMVWAWTPKKR